MNCPRCDNIRLEQLPGDEARFVSCPDCGRVFRVTSDGELVEKWLGPRSLVLYPVLSEDHPQKEASRIADELFASSEPGKRSVFRRFSREQLRQVISEIRLELERPTQNVRDILHLRAKETDLREYLALVADHLGMKLGEVEHANELNSRQDDDTPNRESRSGWSLPLSWILVVVVVLAVVIWGLAALR